MLLHMCTEIRGCPLMTSLLGGRGVSQKVTKSDGGGGVGLFSKPKVTSHTVGHFLGERG